MHTHSFSAKLLMNLEVEKDIDRHERYRFGMECSPNKVLYLRTGISSAPASSHFGVGFRIDRMDTDLGVAVRARLGPTRMPRAAWRWADARWFEDRIPTCSTPRPDATGVGASGACVARADRAAHRGRYGTIG